MYLDHFGLSEAPFADTELGKCFFSGARRGAILDALVYASRHGHGSIMVIGASGSGKSTACRMMLARLPAEVRAIPLAGPVTREEILRAVDHDLSADRRQTLVLIDDAHALPVETLEDVWQLSEASADGRPSLQFVLFGQPELHDLLARPELRQFRKGFCHSFTLEPLSPDEIAHDLRVRMRAAGYRGPEIFSAEAVKLIAGATHGLAGAVNELADKGLHSAFAQNTRRVTRRHIRSALRDSGSVSGRSSRGRFWRQVVGFTLAGSVLVLALFVVWQKSGPPFSAAPSSMTVLPAAQPPLPVAPKMALPAETGKSGKLGAETRARVAATDQWLASVPDNHWFIQLTANDARNAGAIEDLVAAAVRQYGTDQVRVYVAESKGVRRVGIIYGDYPTRGTALSAANRLPKLLHGIKPYPRKVQWLR